MGAGPCWVGGPGAFHLRKWGSPVGPGAERVSRLFLMQENLLHFPLGKERPTERRLV